MKCNPDPYVLRLLAALGTGFDCASNGEIAQALDSTGISPDKIIFANPCKANSFIRSAAKAGVDMMTFDNADELYKIARAHANAKLVVRILTDDSKSLCRLGLKFGAPLVTVPGLLSKAKELGLNVIGVSFHVGSGSYDADAFADAIARARAVFDMGREAGFEFSLLDVGGGFEDATFEKNASVLADAIVRHFPVRDSIRIIAEPGRFYVSRAFRLAAHVIARRASLEEDFGIIAACEDDVNEPRVMCKFSTTFHFSATRLTTCMSLFRLYQRWCVRGVQLYPVRPSDRTSVRAVYGRVFSRTRICPSWRQQRMGPDVRLDRLCVRGDETAHGAESGRLASLRQHGCVHDLCIQSIQRVRAQHRGVHIGGWIGVSRGQKGAGSVCMCAGTEIGTSDAQRRQQRPNYLF